MRGIKILLASIALFLFADVSFAETYTLAANDPDFKDLDHGKAYTWEIDLTGEEYGFDAETEEIVSIELYFDNISNWDNNSNALFVSALDLESATDGAVNEISDNSSGESNYFLSSNYQIDASEIFTLVDLDMPVEASDGKWACPEGCYEWYGKCYSSDWQQVDKVLVEATAEDPGSNITATMNYSASSATLTMSSDDPLTVASGNTQTNFLEGDRYIEGTSGALNNLLTYASDGVFGLGFDPDCHFYNDGITLKITTTTTPGGNPAVPEPATLLLFGMGMIGMSAYGRRRQNTK